MSRGGKEDSRAPGPPRSFLVERFASCLEDEMNTALVKRCDALLLQEFRWRSTVAIVSRTAEEEAKDRRPPGLSERLVRLDDALDRLQGVAAGFGLCVECGGLIDARRLELVPWAPLCGPCAIAEENPGRS